MTIRCPEGMTAYNTGPWLRLPDSEGRVHPVDPPFCIQNNQVTRAAYEGNAFGLIVKLWDGSKYISYGDTPQSNQADRSRPVTNVTRDEALRYCQSKFKGGHLPTLVESMFAPGKPKLELLTNLEHMDALMTQDWLLDRAAQGHLRFPAKTVSPGIRCVAPPINEAE